MRGRMNISERVPCLQCRSSNCGGRCPGRACRHDATAHGAPGRSARSARFGSRCRQSARPPGPPGARPAPGGAACVAVHAQQAACRRLNRRNLGADPHPAFRSPAPGLLFLEHSPSARICVRVGSTGGRRPRQRHRHIHRSARWRGRRGHDVDSAVDAPRRGPSRHGPAIAPASSNSPSRTSDVWSTRIRRYCRDFEKMPWTSPGHRLPSCSEEYDEQVDHEEPSFALVRCSRRPQATGRRREVLGGCRARRDRRRTGVPQRRGRTRGIRRHRGRGRRLLQGAGRELRGPDHRDAATFVRRITPGGETAASNFERLVGLKDKAHYSFLNVSGQDRASAIRRASQLVDFARGVVQR